VAVTVLVKSTKVMLAVPCLPEREGSLLVGVALLGPGVTDHVVPAFLPESAPGCG
jgi:hypothetical protein